MLTLFDFPLDVQVNATLATSASGPDEFTWVRFTLPPQARKQDKIYEDFQGDNSPSWYSLFMSYGWWTLQFCIQLALDSDQMNSSRVDLKVKGLEFEFKFQQLDKLVSVSVSPSSLVK